MKTEVLMPAYLRRDYAAAGPRCYLISAGPFAGHHALVVPLLFTFGILVCKESHWITRWCYGTRNEAIRALDEWTGEGDPPGRWITQKPGDRQGPGSTRV